MPHRPRVVMLSSNLIGSGRCLLLSRNTRALNQARSLSHSSLDQTDRHRSRLSRIWVPTGGVSETHRESGHDKLIRAGFLRQSKPGIFQLLPLGLRVQDKVEHLLDKHMQSLGASRVSLSSFTSERLWEQSGRLEKASELFRFRDRSNSPIMLSPTHEEEITALVKSTMRSYKDLPLKLYQITRKYRDEMRPRHGLLRAREFVMKDLYTFDLTMESALRTYRDVSDAYNAFFADLKLPIMVAEASSGDMGGNHSHEYHLANAIGEDTVATCTSCGYTANDEVATVRPTSKLDNKKPKDITAADFHVWRGITGRRKALVNAWYPRPESAPLGKNIINLHAVKAVVPGLDTGIEETALLFWKILLADAAAGKVRPHIMNVIDSRLAAAFDRLQDELPVFPKGMRQPPIMQTNIRKNSAGASLNLLSLMDGDGCPRCETGTMKVSRAMELGHTFYLGGRYSRPLEAFIDIPQQPGEEPLPIQMGCYGIGVSRIVGAVAEHLADGKGLNWPRAIAPFEVVIIPSSGVNEETLGLYDALADLDVVLDDRKATFGWKMKDADLIGYPVTVILGKAWRETGTCEVQCRRLSINENVASESVPEYVKGLLAQL